jgi:hypothetical protein
MPNTYRARLRGDVLEWLDDRPEELIANQAIDVDVTVPAAPSGPEPRQQGPRMAEILGQLAQLDKRSMPSDPVAWQRRVREDRELPGRGGGC